MSWLCHITQNNGGAWLVRCTPAISVSIVTERRNEPPGEGLVYWKGEERFMAKPSLGGAPPGWGSLGCNPILLCRNGFHSHVCILLLNFPSSRHGPIAKGPIAETPHTICAFCSCLLMGTSNLGCRHMRPGTHGDGSGNGSGAYELVHAMRGSQSRL